LRKLTPSKKGIEKIGKAERDLIYINSNT